tara:strand:+ start:93 stop:539 length:447 start_codon:yes stop_codon:yes gene_type:complete
MIDLKEVLDEWAQDNVISDSQLDKSSRDTPLLHSKYLSKLANAKLLLKRAEFSQKTLLKLKWEWYNGKMDQDKIEELGWDPDPFNGLKVMKGDMDYYYDADPEIQKSEEKIQYYKTLVETLTDIVDTIKWRHQTIGNIIRWKQFESGN